MTVAGGQMFSVHDENGALNTADENIYHYYAKRHVLSPALQRSSPSKQFVSSARRSNFATLLSDISSIHY